MPESSCGLEALAELCRSWDPRIDSLSRRAAEDPLIVPSESNAQHEILRRLEMATWRANTDLVTVKGPGAASRTARVTDLRVVKIPPAYLVLSKLPLNSDRVAQGRKITE